MAPSAAPPIQKSYSAGTCRLDLTLRPSALSQWYPRIITEQVAFKLWMTDERSAEPRLLAEGDRTTLQAIARHIQHRTQATLSIGSPARVNHQPSLKLPDSARLPEPLSYLQLCDISSVLAQYEQATTSRPTSLSLATAASLPIASAEPSLQEIARNQPATRPQTQPATRRQKGKLIPFPTGRRAAWASSAAAALFAIGLTTALWDKTSAPTTSSVAESDIAEPEIVGNNPDRLRLNRPTPPLTNPSVNSSTPTNRSAPRTEQSATPRSPATSPESSTARETAPENASPSNRTSTNSAPPQNNPQTNESNESSEENVVAAAPTPARQPAPASAGDRKITSADSEAESLEASRPQAVARASRDDFSEELSDAAAPADSATIEEAAPSPEAIAQQESETITQVQAYFLKQWSPDESISAPLSYQLQLSSFGEVMSFSALTEAGAAYRDRLLPDSNISFPPANAAALPNGLALKVAIEPNGQISIEKQQEG